MASPSTSSARSTTISRPASIPTCASTVRQRRLAGAVRARAGGRHPRRRRRRSGSARSRRSARGVIERLYGNSSQLNEQGQYAYYGKVGGCLVTGNEDGVKHCAMNVLYSLQHLGYTIPPQADAGWIGEAGPGPSYLDPGSGGPENDFTNRNTTFMTWNLLHLAPDAQGRGWSACARKPALEVGRRLPLRLSEPGLPLIPLAREGSATGTSSGSFSSLRRSTRNARQPQSTRVARWAATFRSGPLTISTAEAGDGARTHDPQLGKLMLYQLSYARSSVDSSSPRRPS